MSEPELYLPADNVADPDDLTLFPQFSQAQLVQIERLAERCEFAAGQVLFEQGDPELPFLVVEKGSVVFFDQKSGDNRYHSKVAAGTFVGDISIFTGAPSLATCRAAEPVQALVMNRVALQTLIAASPDIGEVLLRTMLARRAWLESHDYGILQLVGSRWSPETFRLRDFLGRNQVPFRWFDPESDAESRTLLEQFGVEEDALPVLIAAGQVLHRPAVADVAAALGLLPTLRGEGDTPYDLIVVGAGPAGLAAAVYGASEGLDTLVLDGDSPGGQAGTSSKIENYLGFATGVSGDELTRQATVQARKFGAVLSNPCTVVTLAAEDGLHALELQDGKRVRAHTVVLATGAEYRKLDAENRERFEGSGVYYAAGAPEARQCRGEDVLIVGGGNSAGQAAMFMSEYASKVYLAIRGDALGKSMSQYLVRRIDESPVVEVLTRTQVTALHGDESLTAVTLVTPNEAQRLEVTAVFTMIGAVPRTAWLRDDDGIVLDEDGFVLTGGLGEDEHSAAFSARWPLERGPSYLETTRPGVFAVGDVRSGSVKRVASAVGEGSMAVTFVHRALTEREAAQVQQVAIGVGEADHKA